MKTSGLLFTVISLVASSFMLNAQDTKSSSDFKSADDEVALDVQRGTGDVKLSLQVKDITQYNHIVIERSAENLNYFGKCKYILCSSVKMKDGKIVESDNYPYSATKDVYYRIKTVTNDGVERAYPAVLLAAVSQ
mgnify:CR=1 FL=1